MIEFRKSESTVSSTKRELITLWIGLIKAAAEAPVLEEQ